MKRFLGLAIVLLMILVAPQLFTNLGDYRNLTLIFLFVVLVGAVAGVLWFVNKQGKK